MGISRWLGGGERERQDPQELSDEQAIARYRYLLRTAPPETIEQAHAEAFAQLNERQRRLVLEQLREATPAREREMATTDDPRALARLATRAEMRQPGTMERLFGGAGAPGGMGIGGMLAGSFLGSLAGTVIGSMVAREFMAHAMDHQRGAREDLPSSDARYEDEAAGYEGASAEDQDADSYDTDVGDLDIEI